MKDMIFTNFRDFFCIFSNLIFDLKSFKIIKKLAKIFLFFARVPCGYDVALRVTWQRHAGPRGAYVAHIFYLFHILHIYKWVFSLAYMGRGN